MNLTNLYLFCALIIIPVCTIAQKKDTIAPLVRELTETVIHYQLNPHNSQIPYSTLSEKTINSYSTGQEPSYILTRTPGITVTSDAGNSQGYSYIRMRGIDQTRINITLDGMPLNEPEDQGAYFSNFPDLFNSVSKVQVQRGTGNSQHGIASFAGSIQLYGPDMTKDSTHAEIGVGFGSFQSYRAYGELKTAYKKQSSFYGRISGVGSDGYKYHSGNQSQSAFLSFRTTSGPHAFKINVLVGNQRNELAWIGVTESSIHKDKRTNGNSLENDHFSQGIVQIQHGYRISEKVFLHSALYYNHLDGYYDFDLNNFLGQPSTTELYRYGFLSDMVGAYSNLRVNSKIGTFTTGINASSYNRQHRGSEKQSGEMYTNTGFRKEMSLFVNWSEQIRKWQFTVDLQGRFTDFQYQGDVAMPYMQWHFFNPKAGVGYQTGRHSHVYYHIGFTSREATRNDLFYGNDNLLQSADGKALFNMETARNPESVVDHELGLTVAPHSGYQFKINAFYMDFQHEIVLAGQFGPNGLPLTNSVDKSYRTGIEMEGNWRFHPHMSTNNQTAFCYSRIREDNVEFSPVLTPQLIFQQEFVVNTGKVDFGISGRYQSASWIDFANTTQIDGSVVFNVRVNYHLRHFDCTLFLNNITNTTWYGSGYMGSDGTARYFIQSPFNWYLSVKWIL